MADPRAWLDQVDARDDPALVAAYATTALRAVLDLHRPIGAGFTGTAVFRGRCEPCARVYPCPTVTAITTALEAS